MKFVPHVCGVGVIRRLDGSGSEPQEDECHFDGWYFGEEGERMAKTLFAVWSADYPGWEVSLVRTMLVGTSEQFTDRDLRTVLAWKSKIRWPETV